MPFPEFESFGYERLATSVIDKLKTAAMYLQKPEVFWVSPDEEATYMYQAYPLAQDAEDVDITRLHALPLHTYYDAFNKWLLVRGEHVPNTDSVCFTQFFLESYCPIKETVTEIELDEGEGQIDEVMEELRQKAEVADTNTLQELTGKGSVGLIGALQHLEPHIELFAQQFQVRRDLMTREERLAERAQDYAWFTDSAVEKTKKVQWWVIGDYFATLVFAVRAKGPDFAAAILDEYYKETSGFGLSMFSIDALEENHLERFESEFSHPEIEVVRLIPHSRVPYPKDVANLTPEQKEAFEKLKQ